MGVMDVPSVHTGEPYLRAYTFAPTLLWGQFKEVGPDYQHAFEVGGSMDVKLHTASKESLRVDLGTSILWATSM